MVAVVLTLRFLLLVFNGLAGAERLLVMAMPRLLAARDVSWKPEVPVGGNVKKVEIFCREGQGKGKGGVGVEARDEVEVGIVNMGYTKLSYNVLVRIGNIPFEVAVDTGSSDLWVVSDGCQTGRCKSVPAFPLKTYASPTFRTVNDNRTVFNVSFADSTSVSGFVAQEMVQIGSIQAPSQGLGFVTDSNVTLGDSVSGVLGLGFSRLSRIGALVGAAPILSSLAELGELAYPLFGLSLTRDTSGTLSIGAIDDSIVPDASLISWHEVVPFEPLPHENETTTPLYLHWALPLNKITVNGTEVDLHPSYPNITGRSPLALFDIGNNGISGPFNDVAAMFQALGTIRQVTPGAWAIPCDITATMTFSFAGTNVTLQPKDYLIGPTSGDPKLCLSWPLGLPPNADGLDWHFGTPFLRTVYSIFSYGISGHEPPLIGLYPLYNATSLTSNSSSLASAFSSLSATLSTTVPAVLLPTPTYSTSDYLFNTSVTPVPTIGQVLPSQSDAGASTYSALFKLGTGNKTGLAILTNTTALPKIAPPVTLITLIMTDASGTIHTTVSSASLIPTASLGKPPGTSSQAYSIHVRISRKGRWFWTLFLITLTWTWI